MRRRWIDDALKEPTLLDEVLKYKFKAKLLFTPSPSLSDVSSDSIGSYGSIGSWKSSQGSDDDILSTIGRHSSSGSLSSGSAASLILQELDFSDNEGEDEEEDVEQNVSDEEEYELEYDQKLDLSDSEDEKNSDPNDNDDENNPKQSSVTENGADTRNDHGNGKHETNVNENGDTGNDHGNDEHAELSTPAA